MYVTSGKIERAQKVVIYGPEGIGKSTLAAAFPNPLFIDIENGTAELDVSRTEQPTSWVMLGGIIKEVLDGTAAGFKTVVIDSIDWAEQLCIKHTCSSIGISSLGGDKDFGKSYNELEQEWARFLDLLTRVVQSGIYVVLVGHAKMRKFEQPDEAGAYDRWELSMQKGTAKKTKEWGDSVLFVNYRTFVTEDEKTKSKKASGGKRVVYTTHHPCWDAKNRRDLPEIMDLNSAVVDKIATFQGAVQDSTPRVEPAQEPTFKPESSGPDYLQPLRDLMDRDLVSVAELQLAVFQVGAYPQDTPIGNYAKEFVEGRLVAKWDAVHGVIKENRKEAVKV